MQQAFGTVIVRRPGLPPWMNTVEVARPRTREAGGQAQGGAADASVGLEKISSGPDETWAWNPIYDQWQLLHVIRSGDTLWQMGAHYYGQASRDNVHRIGDVEQNRRIVGSTYDQCVPGDILLIPDLTPPANQPPAPPGNGAEPPPGGAEPPGSGQDGGIDWGDPPANWPPDMPWPPVGGVVTAPYEPPAGGGEQPGPITPTPVGATTPTTGETKGWWTTGKVVGVSAGGLAVVALVIYLATRKPGRRGAPRRRSSRRRRRR
jgi:hypothetical protein